MPKSRTGFAYGLSTEAASIDGVDLTVYAYRPDHPDPDPFFVFHGACRNAADYRELARPFAERHGLLVLAPKFDAARFPCWSYHRGGMFQNRLPRSKDQWTVRLVEGLVAWARWREHRPNARYYLCGYSAGGQFLSRVAAYTQLSVQRIVIASPATYVRPMLEEDAPYGMKGVFPATEVERRLQAYLGRPITFYIGADDADPAAPGLSSSRRAQRQGAHRLERGITTFAIGRSVASRFGWKFRWRLVTVPGVGHSPAEMFAARELATAMALPMPPSPQ